MQILLASIIVLATTNTFHSAIDDEPLTLMGTISIWQYPGSTIAGAEMSDAATLDSTGDRTVASTLCKTTMKTDASVAEVMKYYQDLLKPDANSRNQMGVQPRIGRSVILSDESPGRGFAFHTILVNTDSTSTTMIITRAEGEKSTRITWKHYVRHAAAR